MKKKLADKKIDKKLQKTPEKTSSSINMTNSYHDSPSIMRKRVETSAEMMKISRKWSYDVMESEVSETIPEQLKKYISCSLKEYREIKNLESPDSEMRKIMALFEGKKSVADQ